jgi:hypothetical protein
VKKLILLSILLIGSSACSTVSTSSSTSSSSVLKLPPTSPARIVSGYLEALRDQDFEKAYEFISIGYAGNLDKESYKINMEHSLVKNYNWSLVNYEILGVKILGDQAFVVAELEVKLTPPKSKNQVHKKVRNQYVLNALENEWRITADNCVSNCIKAEDLARRTRY